MSKTKDLTKFSPTQLQEFLMSFDIVMSDIDGEQRSHIETKQNLILLILLVCFYNMYLMQISCERVIKIS